MRAPPFPRPQPALLSRTPQRVADDGARAQRACPQPQAREVDPVEAVYEDRIRGSVREGHGERGARLRRRRLVLPLERREHALAAVARVGRDVHRDREPGHRALQRGTEEAHRGDPDNVPAVDGQRDDPLAGGVALEPPGELLVRKLGRPDPREQGDEVRAPVRRVPDGVEAHEQTSVGS